MVSMRYGSKGGTTGGGTSEGGGGSSVTITELWTNPSPTSTFSAQTVAVSLAGYDYIGICTKISTGSVSKTGIQFFMLDYVTGSSVNGILPYNGQNGQCGRRTFYVLDDLSGVAFQAAYIDNSTSNGYILPYKIYGIKL